MPLHAINIVNFYPFSEVTEAQRYWGKEKFQHRKLPTFHCLAELMFLFGLMLLLPKYVMLLQCSASCDFCTKFSPVPIHFLLRLLLITSQIRMFPVLLMTCSPVLCSSGDPGSK